MTTPNVAGTPQEYWAWTDDGHLVPLGVCDDFSEACEWAYDKHLTYQWLFSRQGLEDFKAEILRELP